MADNPRDQIGVDLPEPEPVETPEETVETPERPEWLPEKFKDESEYVASYHQLEEELRQRGVRDRERDEQIQQLMSVVESLDQRQPQPQQDNGQYAEQLMSAYEADPVGTMVFLAQQAAQQAVLTYQQNQAPLYQQQQLMAGELMASNAETALSARYPDWDEYGGKVGEILEQNQQLLTPDVLASLEKTTNVLEAVYKQVKYDDLVAKLDETVSSQNDQTRMKQQAQTVSGGAGRPGQISPEEEKINRIIAAAKNTSYAAFRGGG